MTEQPFNVYKCLHCGIIYDIQIPRTSIPEDTMLHGYCSNACITGYCRNRVIHPKVVCGKDIRQLKELGWHELADWVSAGGLEELMERENDDV